MSSNKAFIKFISISFSILVFVFIAFGLYQGGKMAYHFGYRVFTEPPIDLPEEGEEKIIEITKAMDGAAIGNLLEKEGLIRDARLFVVQLKLSSYSQKIKEGTYTFSTSMTAYEMMQIMSASEMESTQIEE